MPANRSALAETLATVRKRIASSSRRGLNEENTKATLIEPVLRALGWDTEDVEEVQREFKIKKRDKPVDYGLLELRTPRLFIEAKALGENLDDRRWTNQIMGYAGVAGVEWIVLTDGNEYRIYNTHAPVSVEEKLFRTIRVADDDALVLDTLELLAKDRMEENRIEVLWRAHFVDRRVKVALETLFSSDQDMLLVNYVMQQVKNLSADEVRASLTRCDVRVEFPAPSMELLAEVAKPALAKRGRGTPKRGGAVTLKELIDAGFLRPPVSLRKTYKGQEFTAEIRADGSVYFGGTRYDSLSMAGGAARATIRGLRPGGKMPATNGWTFWRYELPTGDLVEVEHARREYVKKGAAAG